MTSITATLLDCMGSDMTTVNAARVSYNRESEALGASGVDGSPMLPVLNDGDKRLIGYLASNKHTSPFGHAFASFLCEAPIYVCRQMVKHKFLRINEVSRRYISDDPTFYYPPHYRAVAKDKKQGSGGRVGDAEGNAAIANVTKHNARSMMEYRNLLSAGICEEQARSVLPLSMMTKWWWSGSLDAFADMCRLRCAPDAQEESRILAMQISVEMVKRYPVSWAALRGIH